MPPSNIARAYVVPPARTSASCAPHTDGPAQGRLRKHGDDVRLFYSAEMPFAAADPGQGPRMAPDIAPLLNVLDLTPEGRGTDWYPSLSY